MGSYTTGATGEIDSGATQATVANGTGNTEATSCVQPRTL